MTRTKRCDFRNCTCYFFRSFHRAFDCPIAIAKCGNGSSKASLSDQAFWNLGRKSNGHGSVSGTLDNCWKQEKFWFPNVFVILVRSLGSCKHQAWLQRASWAWLIFLFQMLEVCDQYCGKTRTSVLFFMTVYLCQYFLCKTTWSLTKGQFEQAYLGQVQQANQWYHVQFKDIS